MTTANLDFQVKDHWDDGKRIHVIGDISTDGGDYVTGGIPINLSNELIKGTMLLHAEVVGADLAGLYQISPLANGVGNPPEATTGGIIASDCYLIAFSTFGTELTEIALPDADGLTFYGIYSKLI